MNSLLSTIMQDAEIRKSFGQRLKELPKQKGWTQKELGNRIGVSYAQLNKYEGGTTAPPLDKLIALSSALETSIDYLVTGELTEHAPIPNMRLMERFKGLVTFNTDDQATIIKLINAVIIKHRVEHAMNIGTTKKAS